jgi:hypothetical protein
MNGNRHRRDVVFSPEALCLFFSLLLVLAGIVLVLS